MKGFKYKLVATALAVAGFSTNSAVTPDDIILKDTLSKVLPSGELVKSDNNGRLLYLVSMKEASNFTLQGAVNSPSKISVSSLQSEIHRVSQITGVQINPSQLFTTALAGFSAYLHPKDAEKLKASGHVDFVEKVVARQIQTDVGPQFIGADKVWTSPNPRSPGFKGEGVIVGVLDSGINYLHPSFADIAGDGYDHANPLGSGNYLGDCQIRSEYCNDKLIGIVSYAQITDQYDTAGLPKVGIDYNGHGSHVASTAAGNYLENVPFYNVQDNPSDKKVSISGVAPRSNIVSYQVCDPSGACWPNLTVEAIEHAIENGVDVINYSVGGGADSPWSSAEDLAFLEARRAGIHVVTSAGNSGPNPYTVGSPGVAPWITTVAAATHDRGWGDTVLSNFVGGADVPETIKGRGISNALSAEIVDAADYGDGFCNRAFNAGTFNNQIVVCRRGEVPRVEKGENVRLGGGSGLILINVDENVDDTVADPHVIPAIHINREDGERLLEWLANGAGPHEVTINETPKLSDETGANQVAMFSSRGPIAFGSYKPFELLGPDLSAPGVQIYAANAASAPFADPAQNALPPYRFDNGTSMASPHVAGAFALLKQGRPQWSPAEMQSAAMMTSNDTMTANNLSKDGEARSLIENATFFDMGAGMINVEKALNVGFVLPINPDEYLEVDPFKDGDIKSLNMPALVNAKCIFECSWSRSLRGVRSDSWTVSVIASDPGFELSVDKQSFDLANDAYQDITITAKALAAPSSAWSFGKVIFTSNDTGQSQHFVVAVQFKGGSAPELVNFVSYKPNGSVMISGFNSLGVTDFQSVIRGFSAKTKYVGEAVGDSSTNSLTDIFSDVDANFFWQTINVNAGTYKLVTELSSSESPDMDLYVARDLDLDGRPSLYEFSYGDGCVSGNADSTEQCVIDEPIPGQYWIAAHNFGGDTTSAERGTLKIAAVKEVNQFAEVIGPDSTATGELFDVVVNFDLPAERETDEFIGYMQSGTSSETPDDIGETLVNVNVIDLSPRIDLADYMLAGEPLKISLAFDNLGNVPEQSNLRLSGLPELPIISSSHDLDIIGGETTLTVAQYVEQGLELTIEFDTSEFVGFISDVFKIVLEPEGLEAQEIATRTFTVESAPVAKINGKSAISISVEENGQLTLDATQSSSAKPDDVLQFSWTVVEGSELVKLQQNAQVQNLTLPEVSSSTRVVVSLTVNNGRASSEPIYVEIQIQDKPSTSGGSTGLFLIVLTVISLCARARSRWAA